jgi:peptidoglycan/LPS O-acetylase OafA/YrhL
VWHYTLFGAAILIFSIHFSGFLRLIFSHRYPVFLGSISFPLYLLHSLMMRSILVWVVFGLLPSSVPERWIPIGSNPQRIIPVLSASMTLIAFGSWLALLMYLSTLWRDRVDRLSVTFAQWAEEAMLGQKSLWAPFHRLIGFFLTHRRNTSGTGDMEERTLEKRV